MTTNKKLLKQVVLKLTEDDQDLVDLLNQSQTNSSTTVKMLISMALNNNQELINQSGILKFKLNEINNNQQNKNAYKEEKNQNNLSDESKTRFSNLGKS